MPEWDGIPLRDIVSERLNQHVILDNDTNFGVVAEHRYGAARGAGDVVYITFSTGVGICSELKAIALMEPLRKFGWLRGWI